MSSQKSEDLKNKLLIRKAIADRVLSEFCFTSLATARGRNEPNSQINSREYTDAVSSLEKEGCRHNSLVAVLRMAAAVKAFENTYSAPRVRAVRTLANKMRRLANEIETIERSHFSTILREQEIAKLRAQTASGDKLRFPFLDLPTWLELNAWMYDTWAELAAQHIPPKDFGGDRFARVFVALYVKSATGRPYFPAVSRLLESVGFAVHSTAQFSREVNAFQSDYPRSCGHLEAAFEFIHPPTKGTYLVKYSIPHSQAMIELAKIDAMNRKAIEGRRHEDEPRDTGTLR